MAVQVLQPGRLAEAEELIMDEAILDVVELVERSTLKRSRLTSPGRFFSLFDLL